MNESLGIGLEMVREGFLWVDRAGAVWRTAKRTPAGRVATHPPKRAECHLKNGYLGVTFWRDSQQHLVLAHRLVWTALNGPIPLNADINHRDGNKKNNTPANLETVSRGENHRHAYRTGLRKLAKSIPAPILDRVRPEAKRLRALRKSYAEIARAIGVSQTTAFRAVNS